MLCAKSGHYVVQFFHGYIPAVDSFAERFGIAFRPVSFRTVYIEGVGDGIACAEIAAGSPGQAYGCLQAVLFLQDYRVLSLGRDLQLFASFRIACLVFIYVDAASGDAEGNGGQCQYCI